MLFLIFSLLGLSAVAECKVIGEDVWYGYKRTRLDFDETSGNADSMGVILTARIQTRQH